MFATKSEENIQKQIAELQRIIDECSKIVFFGGAGVSTESGIPDFRSSTGLYKQQWKYSPETIISRTFFETHTEEFFRFYREKMLVLDAKPNPAHLKLAELEKSGKLQCVVTQNIDGLHQDAESKNVYELHGSVLRNFCTKCGKFFDAQYIKDSTGVPKCNHPGCSGIVKPDVILYEEGLDDDTLNESVSAIAKADCLIIGGTSLVVYPAASLIHYFKGKYLVLLNKSYTQYDTDAHLAIHENIGEVLSKIKIN